MRIVGPTQDEIGKLLLKVVTEAIVKLHEDVFDELQELGVICFRPHPEKGKHERFTETFKVSTEAFSVDIVLSVNLPTED